MSPLFKKLNLGKHSVIHVLHAPASFEPELAALEGVDVEREASAPCRFAIAFAVTQADLDDASASLVNACEGDAVLWIAYPKGTSKRLPLPVQSRLRLAGARRRRVRTGAHGRHRRRLVGPSLSQGRAHQDHGASALGRHLRSRPAQGLVRLGDMTTEAVPPSPSAFSTRALPSTRTVAAPDGSDVRVLLGLHAGAMAHFALVAGAVASAVEHRTVEEIWYVLSGRGEMWRRQGEREETVVLEPGLSLTIPLGTRFQFRASATTSLAVVAVTMPPWPGPDEAILVAGPWAPSL